MKMGMDMSGSGNEYIHYITFHWIILLMFGEYKVVFLSWTDENKRGKIPIWKSKSGTKYVPNTNKNLRDEEYSWWRRWWTDCRCFRWWRRWFWRRRKWIGCRCFVDRRRKKTNKSKMLVLCRSKKKEDEQIYQACSWLLVFGDLHFCDLSRHLSIFEDDTIDCFLFHPNWRGMKFTLIYYNH